MAKILSVSEMEKHLLSLSSDENLSIANMVSEQQNPSSILTVYGARTEISALARCIINVHPGYPFFSDKLKRKILTELCNILNSVTNDISVRDLFARFQLIPELIPDNHFLLKLGDSVLRRTRGKYINVGRNYIVAKNLESDVYIGRHDGIGIIAIKKFSALPEQSLELYRTQVLDLINTSRALIIDLRDNPGGPSTLATMIANTILGTDIIPRSRRMFIRTNNDARKFYSCTKLSKDGLDFTHDPALRADNTKFRLSKGYNSLYQRPIYFLINTKTASSAELLINYFRYYKNATLVGAHTAGALQYGAVFWGMLTRSRILFQIGAHYMEIPRKRNFETHGYPPDIKCNDGQDAMAIAINDINEKS